MRGEGFIKGRSTVWKNERGRLIKGRSIVGKNGRGTEEFAT